MHAGTGPHGTHRRRRGQSRGTGALLRARSAEALVRAPVRFLLVSLLAAAAVCAAEKADRWKVLYSYDDLNSSLVINDFKFLTAQRGIAGGFLLDKNGKVKPTTVVTSDGGTHWTLSPIKDVPISLFFLESRGWMVTEEAVWGSEDAGRTWRK